MALLYRERFLLSGDHLWWSPKRKELSDSRNYCWYSWEQQTGSMERLLHHRFEWVLPGHGRRHRASTREMHESLARLITRMRQRR